MPDHETQAKKNLEAQIEALEESEASGVLMTYDNYIAKLKTLNEITKEQYKKDRHGLNKPLTVIELDELRRIYREAGDEGQLMLDNLSHRKDSPTYALIKNIQDMLAKDLQMLNAVDETTLAGGTVSLQRIVDNARIQTVDITGRDLGTVGANLSSRIPFNHVSADGSEMPGVFTPETHMDITAGYDKVIDEMNVLYPDLAPYFALYKDGAMKYFRDLAKREGRNPDKVSETDYMFSIMGNLREKNGEITIQKVLQCYKKTVPDKYREFTEALDASPYGTQAIEYYIKQVSKHYTASAVNIKSARVANNSRLDCRNSAMSSVADLLGVPKLICRATPMKIIKDGKEVNGTFMSMAEGVDILSCLDMHADHAAYMSSGSVFCNTNGLKDIADLQVLDFVCGNVDRHSCNMFYKFDTSDPDPAKHKFLGVQGIDNDASFGTFVPSNPAEACNRMVSLNNMKVISKSMSEKLLALNADTLALILRGQGLEEAQISAASKRLAILKSYISKSIRKYEALSPDDKSLIEASPNSVLTGTVRIVDDDKFNKLNLVELSKTRDNLGNTFWMAEGFQEICKEEKVEHPHRKQLVPKKVEELKVFVLKQGELNMATEWVKSLTDATSMNRTSPEFKAILAAAKRYKGFCEANKGAVLSEDLYAIRRSMLKDVNKAAEAYVSNKRAKVKAPKPYTQHRIDTAVRIAEEAGGVWQENFYENVMGQLGPNTAKRYADGLHEYADRALEDFNAKMRKMAEQIAAEHPQKAAPAKKNAAKKPSQPGLIT